MTPNQDAAIMIILLGSKLIPNANCLKTLKILISRSLINLIPPELRCTLGFPLLRRIVKLSKKNQNFQKNSKILKNPHSDAHWGFLY